MRRLINDFQVLRTATRAWRLKKMAAFVLDFEDTSRRAGRQTHADWNLFSVVGIETDEVRHSQFLAWLLDTEADHGQGSLFMKAFADVCHLDIAPDGLERYWVRTEFPGIESIIDILVCRRGEFLIYLENKILAQEGLDQAGREYRDMRRFGSELRIPEKRMYAIFLTPSGRRPRSGDASLWRAVSYREVATGFAGLLPEITSPKVKLVLRDWIETVLTFGGTNEYVL